MSHGALSKEAHETLAIGMNRIKGASCSGEGGEDLMDTIKAHRLWLEESGELEERRRVRQRVRIQDVMDRELRRTVWHSDAVLAELDQALDRINKGKDTAYSVAGDILDRLLR